MTVPCSSLTNDYDRIDSACIDLELIKILNQYLGSTTNFGRERFRENVKGKGELSACLAAN